MRTWSNLPEALEVLAEIVVKDPHDKGKRVDKLKKWARREGEDYSDAFENLCDALLKRWDETEDLFAYADGEIRNLQGQLEDLGAR